MGTKPHALIERPWGRGEGVLALMADGELPLVPVLLLTDRPYSPRLAAIGRLSVRSYLSWPAPPRLLGRAIREALADVAIGHPSPEMDLPANEWAAAGPQPTA